MDGNGSSSSSNEDNPAADGSAKAPTCAPAGDRTAPDKCTCCHHPKLESHFFAASENGSLDDASTSWAGKLDDFRDAADSNCGRCALVLDAVQTYCTHIQHHSEKLIIYALAFRTTWGDDPSRPIIIRVDVVEKDSGARRRLEVFRVEGQETKLSSCSRIPDWNVVVKRLPAEDPACDEALGKIRTWVEECTRNHKGCPQPTKTSLPKRVLQVTESTVYLRENILTEAKYACLSHCWGPRGPALRLLRNTAERLSNGVAIDKLPKTFADAARTCLGLGVHYLWIDALCIQQDDDDDWKEAAATMADIYENAFFTLATGSSEDSDAGFRPLNMTRFQYHKLDRSNLYVREAEAALPSSQWGLYLESERSFWPLLTRAWVYQEKRLSPRIIYFNVYQMLWKCGAVIRSEDGHFDHDYNYSEQSEDENDGLRQMGFQDDDPAQAWREAVAEYSGLALTYERDRLPAIAAVAQRMMRIRKADVYLAGMWRSSILRDLIWSVAELEHMQSRPTTTAPTWSWVSVASRVKWDDGQRPLPAVELLSLTFTPVGPPRVGEVKDTSIIIRSLFWKSSTTQRTP